MKAEEVAKICNLEKFLQWSTFLQFLAPVSFQLLTRISELISNSSCLSRLEDVGLFSWYNYKNSHNVPIGLITLIMLISLSVILSGP